jgi:Zn-dependent protease with chaperone function
VGFGDALVTEYTSARRDHREPLWDRIDRNRLKVAAFIAVFIAAAAVSAALLVAVGGVFVGLALLRGGETQFFGALPYLALGALALGAVLAAIHIGRTLATPERKLPGLFGAVPSQAGTLPITESALHDMAIAAGFARPPRLWLIDDCDRVNAFALGMDEGKTLIGVTRGFTDRLTADDQRAVFANLMARVKAGDTLWATVLSAIMGPIWAQKSDQLARQNAPEDEPSWAEALSGGALEGTAREAPEGVIGVFVLGFLGVVLTELLMAGHERAAMAAAEKADAEGMLLLKDPKQMLMALNDVLQANNTVPGAMEAYSALFFCWAGFGYAPEEDPEMQRLGRLREVLGAAGA